MTRREAFPPWPQLIGELLRAEKTQLTEKAHALMRRSVQAAVELGTVGHWEEAEAGGALWIYANGYVSEGRGQSSAGGHGKQGSHPARIAALRDLPVPARMVFVDGGGNVWQEVWLDINEPEVAHIHDDPTHKRL